MPGPRSNWSCYIFDADTCASVQAQNKADIFDHAQAGAASNAAVRQAYGDGKACDSNMKWSASSNTTSC
jgi:hypothetical protein